MVRLHGMGIALGITIAGVASGGSLSVGSERDISRVPIEHAFRVLEQVPAGKMILNRASKRFSVTGHSGLLSLFRWGSVSRTDAILTRHYDSKTRGEERERKVTIILKRNQGLDDLVLDIAHELTHAVADPSWDPYDPELTVASYIHSTIEGEGGEVDAVTTECRVSLELAQQYGTSAERCKRYRNEKGGVSRNLVVKDFYRVGRWREKIAQRLGADVALFPMLSSESPQLYSSTGNAPYPLALEREYDELTHVACENSRRRIDLLNGRSPASGEQADERSVRESEQATLFLTRRCDS